MMLRLWSVLFTGNVASGLVVSICKQFNCDHAQLKNFFMVFFTKSTKNIKKF